MNKAFKKDRFNIANSKYTKELGIDMGLEERKINIIHPGTDYPIKILKENESEAKNIFGFAFPKIILPFQYSRGEFPNSWKLAHVFPIPNKGDTSIPSNYRPIALTSILSKTMESIVVDRLFKHLEKHQLLSDH